MQKIYNKTIEYLTLKIPNFVRIGMLKSPQFTCPYCAERTSMSKIPLNEIYKCLHCQRKGNILDFVRHLEPDKVEWTDNQILKYLGQLLNVEVTTDEDVDFILRFYKVNNFDLVPVQRNGKIPIEKEWTVKNHQDIEEWKKWLEQDLNIGVKTGKVSNITVIDIDTKKIPPKLKELLIKYEGLIQETNKGYHYFFQYDDTLPKSSFDFEGAHIDIENNGGQVVIYPSKVDDIDRKWIQQSAIPKILDEFKTFLLSQLKNNGLRSKELETVSSDNSQIGMVGEGNRNNFLIKFGGILRKTLDINQTKNVIELVNSNFVKPPLPSREIQTIVGSLDKYINFDHQDLAQKVLSYLKIVGDATARDVKEVVSESKELVDKTLAYLIKEGFVIKHSRAYHIIRKADWKDTLGNFDNRLNFKVPYFYDVAYFNWGDLVLLGGKTKVGKTSIAMNVIKDLVGQGIKPYYIGLEPGSRFKRIWRDLGGTETQFYWDFVADPTKIEFEPNAVTIIDWLLIEDKASTDTIFKYFIEQLFKTNGFLIIFMQLKESNGDWFAPNMVKQFPSLAARYFYTDENDGTEGKWIIDAIREPKEKIKIAQIPCIYDWDKRTLTRLDEIKNGGKV